MYVEASAPFEAQYAHGGAGLVGTIEVAVLDGDGNTVIGPATTNITEEEVGGTPIGVYTWNAPAAPGVLGQYVIVWSPDGTWDAETTSTPDELVVVEEGASGSLPPLPAPVDGGAVSGPCSAWTTSLQISNCLGVLNSNVYDDAIAAASEILYELSARRFPGLCQSTARPCQTDGVWCGVQVLSRGYVINWSGWNWGFSCGCTPLSEVPLAGTPVREITEVKIDGVVLDPAEYGVWGRKWLYRKNSERWPACQNLSEDDDEPGTWSVTYTHGQAIPISGQMAARDLAIAIYQECSSSEDGDCDIPEGVIQIQRQGLTISKPAFITWGRDFTGNWNTGIKSVDAFLQAYNPKGLMRRPVLYVPGAQKQARRVG